MFVFKIHKLNWFTPANVAAGQAPNFDRQWMDETSFGDSSLGEWFWDGACLLVASAFSFEITRRFAGFRWGVAAAVASLALFLAGPGYVFIGRGLSEITSTGFIYLAALVALRSRHGSWTAAVWAGTMFGASPPFVTMP